MELRHLRYFLILAEELHFTRAAHRIGIAQPPLTQQIQALEKELGAQLLNRTPGNISLTAAGRVFLEETRFILDRVDNAVVRTRLYAHGMAGRICIGFTESASFHPGVTSTLYLYRKAYPDVELTLQESPSTQLIDGLRQGRVNAVFVRLPIATAGDISFQKIANESMVVAVHKQHRLASAESVPLIELKNESFILYPRANRFDLTDRIISACEECGFKPLIVQQASRISSTINLVASSLGITIVPQCINTSRPDLVRYLRIRGTDLHADLGIAYLSADKSATLEQLLLIIGTQFHVG